MSAAICEDIVGVWLDEGLHADWRQRFRVIRTFANVRSAYQDITIFEAARFGRVLVLDGAIQITEADEFIYQEMLVHVPLIVHGAPRRVLIIGGGDGGILRRVLQHRTIEQVVMVELDADVIRLAREFLPAIGGAAWDDPRAQVIVGDGIQFVAEAPDNSFDVIIVDSTDPVGPGEVLFSEEFYLNCSRLLSDGGVLVNQGGVPFMQPGELQASTRRRLRAFTHTSVFLAAVPTYIGGFMALGISSNRSIGAELPVVEIQDRATAAGIAGTTRYWTPEVHLASFQIPPYINSIVTDAGHGPDL